MCFSEHPWHFACNTPCFSKYCYFLPVQWQFVSWKASNATSVFQDSTCVWNFEMYCTFVLIHHPSPSRNYVPPLHLSTHGKALARVLNCEKGSVFALNRVSLCFQQCCFCMREEGRRKVQRKKAKDEEWVDVMVFSEGMTRYSSFKNLIFFIWTLEHHTFIHCRP